MSFSEEFIIGRKRRASKYGRFPRWLNYHLAGKTSPLTPVYSPSTHKANFKSASSVTKRRSPQKYEKKWKYFDDPRHVNYVAPYDTLYGVLPEGMMWPENTDEKRYGTSGECKEANRRTQVYKEGLSKNEEPEIVQFLRRVWGPLVEKNRVTADILEQFDRSAYKNLNKLRSRIRRAPDLFSEETKDFIALIPIQGDLTTKNLSDTCSVIAIYREQSKGIFKQGQRLIKQGKTRELTPEEKEIIALRRLLASAYNRDRRLRRTSTMASPTP